MALVYLINIIQFMIILRAIFSWFPSLGFGRSSIYSTLVRLTDPILNPIKKLIYKIGALRDLPIDISPIAAYFILAFIGRMISIL